MVTYYSDINSFIEATVGKEGLPFELRYRRWLSFISAEKKEKILRYRQEHDRLRSMVGTLLVTYYIFAGRKKGDADTHSDDILIPADLLLSELSTGNASPLDFQYSQLGKPTLKNHPDISFSVSHSGSYAAAAIIESHESGSIGLDLQETDRNESTLRISERFYTAFEQKLMNVQDKKQRTEIFYKIWTGKEAFLKMTGEGILRDLTSFSVDPDNMKIITDKDCENISLTYPPAPEGYIICVCRQNTDMQ
jgi:phosphopantetheine--protein transferase-like protein